ncbi:MAG: SUMF1/EgtB/PvdO family nonheme iron enzyme [Nitrospinales bacterium]
MSDMNNDSIAPRQKDAPAERQTESLAGRLRPEEDRDWLIAVYRKHALRLVAADLDAALGGGRGPSHYIPRALLDDNPAQFRQSLQEQVFPTPRELREDLLEIAVGKIMLEAGSGMGKTTFLKIYQEESLRDETRWFPLPVYFHLGLLPEGTGFSHFFDRVFHSVLQVILLEKEECPDLQLDEDILLRTLELLANENRFLFLLDGLEQLPPEDRFLVYKAIVLEGELFRGNFIVLAARPFSFGPLADEDVMRAGRESCFRITFDKVAAKDRKAYLGDALSKDIEALHLYNPELLDTPLLLQMIRRLSDDGLLRDVKIKTDIYSRYFLRRPGTEAADDALSGDKLTSNPWLARLAETAFRLAEEGRFQRFENVEAGFDEAVLTDAEGSPGVDVLASAPDDIVERVRGRWQFRHPSFQEYLAARQLAGNADWEKTVERHCRDEKWEGIWKFFAGLTPSRNDAFYEILLREGALFAAGNALQEAQGLAEDKALVTQQFLKYQCKERFPQFSRYRLAAVDRVKEKADRRLLQQWIAVQLRREKRDSRLLFGVFELLLALHDIDLLELVDRQDFAPLAAVEELKAFLDESGDPQVVNPGVVKTWGEMVTVPAGKFIYQEEKDEEDRIDLPEYAVMKYPVTNALYKEFDPNYRLLYERYSHQDDQPVIGVNYFEAHIFAIWLGKRLPTEQEWEKAARGTDGRDYPWGDAIGYQSGYANTSDFVLGRTSAVTEFDKGKSSYGCQDMAGNVWEWCVQPFASKYTTQKILRGGSWLNYLVHAKCTFRNSFDPAERYPTVGLRCVSRQKTWDE